MTSSSTRKVKENMRALGFACEILELSESARTVPDAARAIGCKLGQIVKSLIFKGQSTGKTILALVSGLNRADEGKLSVLVGEPIGRADPEFVRLVTGFAIGGVPPVGHPQPIETYIDQDLMQYDTVWSAAGTPYAVFGSTPADLARMTGGKVVPLK
ncbi:MAG: YbaK/EbsC family protein [Chloroflexi bacterium]|nr:YbaK/EbsC family protein [Chloroflexota bacterium]